MRALSRSIYRLSGRSAETCLGGVTGAGAAVASFSFALPPAPLYRVIRVLVVWESDSTGSGTDPYLRINADSGSNYTRGAWYCAGTGISGEQGTGTSFAMPITTNDPYQNLSHMAEFYLHHGEAGETDDLLIMGHGGWQYSASTFRMTAVFAATYNRNAAQTSISITRTTGNFDVNTRVMLWGIR